MFTNVTTNELTSQMIEMAKAAPTIMAPAYIIPKYRVPIGDKLLETSPIGLRPLLTEIVQAEGPKHVDEIANRVVQTYGRSHLTNLLHINSLASLPSPC